MGIRFLCPNGHRLNVKAFLAGKRGICPDCGIGVDIPYESQIPSRREARQNQAALASVAASCASGNSSGRPAGGSAFTESLNSEEDAIFGPDDDLALETRQKTFQNDDANPRSTDDHTAKTIPTSDSSKASHSSDDPIEEGSQLVWYVRPPSGGQFGPAVGEIMKRWLGEGRVSGDSLVWREGWPDWRVASKVFPDLAEALSDEQPADSPAEPSGFNTAPTSSSASDSAALIGSVGPGLSTASDHTAAIPAFKVDSDSPGADATSRTAIYSKSRRKSGSWGVVTVVLLSIMCIGLVVVAFFVISKTL